MELSLNSFDIVVWSVEVRGEIEAISGDTGIDSNVVDGDSTEGKNVLSRYSSQPPNHLSKSLGRNDGAGFSSILESCVDWAYFRVE